jgi:hypothetical protein
MTELTDHQAKLFALELRRRRPVGDSARIGICVQCQDSFDIRAATASR